MLKPHGDRMRAIIIFIILLTCAGSVFGDDGEEMRVFLKDHKPYVNCENTIYEICVAYEHSAFYTFKFREFRYFQVGDNCVVTAVFSVSDPRAIFLERSSAITRKHLDKAKRKLLIEWIVDADRKAKPYNFFSYGALRIFESDFQKG